MNHRSGTIGQRLPFGGLILQLIAVAALTAVEHPSPAGVALAIVAIVATLTHIAGLALVARAKGHHPAWCLLGLFSIVGLSIVLALPDLD